MRTVRMSEEHYPPFEVDIILSAINSPSALPLQFDGPWVQLWWCFSTCVSLHVLFLLYRLSNSRAPKRPNLLLSPQKPHVFSWLHQLLPGHWLSISSSLLVHSFQLFSYHLRLIVSLIQLRSPIFHSPSSFSQFHTIKTLNFWVLPFHFFLPSSH